MEILIPVLIEYTTEIFSKDYNPFVSNSVEYIGLYIVDFV